MVGRLTVVGIKYGRLSDAMLVQLKIKSWRLDKRHARSSQQKNVGPTFDGASGPQFLFAVRPAANLRAEIDFTLARVPIDYCFNDPSHGYEWISRYVYI